MGFNFRNAKNNNMRDYNLGSDMYPDYALFDETKTYNAGEVVLWKGFLYVVKSGQTSIPNPKGDFTHNPTTDTTIWEPYEQAFNYAQCRISTTDTTITNTEKTVVIDDIVSNQGIVDYLDNGEIVLSSNKLCHFTVSVTYQITSGTSRSAVISKVQWWDGQDWMDVDGTIMYTYHRDNNAGETTACCSFILDGRVAQRIRIRARRYTGSSTITTVQNSTSITIVEIEGARGAQGPPGPPGADGDITWEGAWNSTRNYLPNQAVEYQGSSYVCIQATTANQPPTDTNYWDLMAQKGADGSGSSINIREDGNLIPNTPHTDLDFRHPLVAQDAGSGIAQVSLIIPYGIYGASGDQTITSNTIWQVLQLNETLVENSDYFQRSGYRIYLQQDCKVLVCYSIYYYLDSGDSARNTMQSALRLNGSTILDYSMAGAYTRGYNYSRHANSTIPYTLLKFQSGDYIEVVFRASDDYQSPHVGVKQSWITLQVIG